MGVLEPEPIQRPSCSPCSGTMRNSESDLATGARSASQTSAATTVAASSSQGAKRVIVFESDRTR